MINTIISMRGALERPEFFGSQLAGETWANWRVLLIAIAGEELTAEELVIFQRLTNRCWQAALTLSSGRRVFAARADRR
jgi:hypothetical protein